MGFSLAALVDACEKIDHKAVTEQCDALEALLKTPAAAPPIAAAEAKAALNALRSCRHFKDLERISAGLISAGFTSARTHRQHAQALLDIGKVDTIRAAIDELKQLVVDTQNDPEENAEARGLLGRAFKQKYVNSLGPNVDPADLAGLLSQAATWYASAYDTNPNEYLWHGINVVACSSRARRDGLSLAGFPASAQNEKATAQTILGRIELLDAAGKAQNWDYATACEACVGLDRPDEALRWAKIYVNHPGTGAFELASTFRQLTEVWELGGPDDPANFHPVVACLLEKLGTLDRGFLVMVSGPEANTSHASIGGLEKTFSDGAIQTITWWATVLQRCRNIARVNDVNDFTWGTGFLIKAKNLGLTKRDGYLLITNAHVLSDSAADSPAILWPTAQPKLQFDQQQKNGNPSLFNASNLLCTSPPEELDYAALELAAVPSDLDDMPVAKFPPVVDGLNPVFVVGHPKGQPLSISTRNNVLLDVDDRRLQYRAATEGGSSGSPVFNEAWAVVALHHAGLPNLNKLHPPPETYEANEGLWIQAVAADIRKKLEPSP